MKKHTPSPWKPCKANDLHGHDHFVMTPLGFLGYLPKESEGGGMQLFTEADAHLISAAPELLEALEGWIWARENGASEDLAEKYAREVIAKANGAKQ